MSGLQTLAGHAPCIVVMGVAGCGKSTYGQALASACELPYIEGDDYHSAASTAKMKSGTPLDDNDRNAWLQALANLLRAQEGGAVLTCSALKRDYRQRLRNARPGLLFVHLQITPGEALRRVASRSGHIFPPSLLQSQFDTLESPADEAGVLTLDAAATLNQNLQQAMAWLRPESSP